MHRRELNKLFASVQKEGKTIVPLRIYFNEDGRAKMEVLLPRVKKSP